MLLMLLFLGGGASTAAPVDTHDGWAIHQLAQERVRKHPRIHQPDQASEIAAEMRATLAPKVTAPEPMVVQTYDDDEEALLCLLI